MSIASQLYANRKTIAKGIKAAAFSTISTLTVLGYLLMNYLTGLLASLLVWLRVMAAAVGLDPQFIVEKSDQAKVAFAAIVVQCSRVEQLFPLGEISGMIALAASIVLSIRATRWMMSFVPFMATG